MSFSFPTTRAALVLFAGLALNAAPALAQSDTALEGAWTPKVGNGSLAKLVLTDANGVLQVHGYGTCSPTDCDWGTVSGVVYGKNVSDTTGTTFTAMYNFGFKTEILTGTLNATGRLMTINEYDAFAPGDSRDAYHVSNVLKK